MVVAIWVSLVLINAWIMYIAFILYQILEELKKDK